MLNVADDDDAVCWWLVGWLLLPLGLLGLVRLCSVRRFHIGEYFLVSLLLYEEIWRISDGKAAHRKRKIMHSIEMQLCVRLVLLASPRERAGEERL